MTLKKYTIARGLKTMLHLRDNTPYLQIEEKYITDLQIIANKTLPQIGTSAGESLLIFPHAFGLHGDDIDKSEVLFLNGRNLHTTNVMGFIGVNDTNISISSRFTNGENKDYFLHYMLQKVLSINMLKLSHTNSTDPVWNFLPYLFPYFLDKALAQGMYKKYKNNKYNDPNIKGPIDVARHIRQNYPFKGNISYNTREHVYDNEVTQLIRHTIEYIKTLKMERHILTFSSEILENTALINQATPSYKKNSLRQVINANLRPLHHPYFTNYLPLQKLCLRILNKGKMSFGKHKDKIYGVLFDGAWLWEEYLYTILKDMGFTHPQNKIRRAPLNMFQHGDSWPCYPDFYKQGIIIDAKYKRLEHKVQREDLFQIISYMHITKAEQGIFIYPCRQNDCRTRGTLYGHAGEVKTFSFAIAQEGEEYKNFISRMQQQEIDFKNKLAEELS